MKNGSTNKLFHTSSSSSKSVSPDTFMSGTNSVYVDEMYRAWKMNPQSVHKSWDAYFNALESGASTEMSFIPPPGLQSGSEEYLNLANKLSPTEQSDSLGLSYLIRAYQVRGHEIANLDPLGLHTFRPPNPPKELDLTFHGFSENDLDRPMRMKGTSYGGHKGFLYDLSLGPEVTLRTVLDTLKRTYCQTLGVEYMHMTSREKCNWIRTRVESPSWLTYTKEKKLHIFERLMFADSFENFLAQKYNTTKRFGLDGGEAVIPGLKSLIDRGSELGVESFVFGMPHRGRLNVLANVLRKPMELMFKEFQGTHYDMDEFTQNAEGDDWSTSGDVKYHLGTSMNRVYPDGRTVHLSLLANPSHLEAVNTVVEGKARAKQFYAGDRPEDKKKFMPVLLHGDAAFAGQGIVYETLQLAKVQDYSTGGTVHVIVNNQVGFTTDPSQSRSTLYSSDLGKAFDIPIFHCNGDDPLSVVTAFEMAAEWRQEWGEDCIIDMLCYRRNGHNELDQPLFTQPVLYKNIKSHPPTSKVYENNLINSGVATKEELKEIKDFVMSEYNGAFERSKDYPLASLDENWLSARWKGFKGPAQLSRIRATGIHKDRLTEIGLKSSSVPEGFKLHKQLEKILALRRKTIEQGHSIDWATAEALAFGSLLMEGNHVRISGQDVERGTFSHRHCVLHDQITNETYTPLNNLRANKTPIRSTLDEPIENAQALFTARNSILSEFGVLGFELGYSLENPNALVIWEAQFGDFVNGAQIMIDQFIVAGESKWLRQSGLVMLLPHGYDGQGAEHSSCRYERFLQLVDDDEDHIPEMEDGKRAQIQKANIQVVNCTTPANYYHVLRRQLHRDFRKPLIVVAPKSLLRHKHAVSTLDDMDEGMRFHRIYRETDPSIREDNPENVKKVVLCTGKVYYELVDEREKRGLKDTAIVRVEQVAPFPFDKVVSEISHFPNVEKIVWAQEEPKNNGAWFYVKPRIMTATRDLMGKEFSPIYVGRPPSAAPATGMSKVHAMEQKALVEGTFDC